MLGARRSSIIPARTKAAAKADFRPVSFSVPGIVKCRMLSYPCATIGVGPINANNVRVLPMNPYRVRLIIPNPTVATLFMAFDQNDLQGIPIAAGSYYAETGDSVTIDAVFLRGVANSLRVYEGVPIDEGVRRR
jgi:hypothetical protein